MKLVQDPISEFSSTGIITKSGESHEFDVVILATGFEMLHCPYPIYGRNKEKHMYEIWGDEPRAYLGTVHPSKLDDVGWKDLLELANSKQPCVQTYPTSSTWSVPAPVSGITPSST